MTIISQRALDRRIKRQLKNQQLEFFAACAPGFETELSQELSKITGVEAVNTERGGVGFSSSLDAIYHCNLNLRSAHRVLLRIGNFLSQNHPMLYDHARKLPWEIYLGQNSNYSLKISSKRSRLIHNSKIAETLAAAISRRLQENGLAARAKDKAKIEIHIRLFKDRAQLSINTSGEHLHKRGYRRFAGRASIRETLAASILLRAKVKGYKYLFDPMCGSGTFLTEAALIATNSPAGLYREFAFEHMPFFQESKWLRFKKEAFERITALEMEIAGSDIDAQSIERARANTISAGFDKNILLSVKDARNYVYRKNNQLIVSNLPYGKQSLKPQQIEKLNKAFASNLKANYKKNHFSIITTQAQIFAEAGLDFDEQRFTNGGLKVTLIQGVVD